MASSDGGFLGVDRSLTGRRWRARPADASQVREISLRHGLGESLARALVARGVGVDLAPQFLNPTLRGSFPDPSTFADMDSAARILVDAVTSGRPTVIFADYDVDGATSAAQLIRWFRCLDFEPRLYVPDRMTEGYGPSPAAFRRIHNDGAELVVTLDCGAGARDALEAASEIGLDVVVIDHHPQAGGWPAISALVNPNRGDCPSGQGVLPAAGVTFVLLAALNREARRRGLFATRPEPDLRQWIDLAALGSICDVTSLTGFNRTLTAIGLRAMSEWRNPGLRALMEVAGRETCVAGVGEAGFVLGPRINAGGRIGRSDLGARLLATDDVAEARALAAELHRLNDLRRQAERAMFEEAVEFISGLSNLDDDAPALVVADERWHPGIVGIVASRLRERYNKPAVVVGIDRQADIGRGSGRSQASIDLGRAVRAAADAGILMTGGGHAMAAGLTLRPAMLPDFRAFICEWLNSNSDEAVTSDEMLIDALVAPGPGAGASLDAFSVLAPHGPGNPPPTFALDGVRISRPAPVRGGHVRCTFVSGDGASLPAIAWRADQTAIGARLLSGQGEVLAAGRLRRETWNGRTRVEMEIEDLAEPAGERQASARLRGEVRLPIPAASAGPSSIG